MRSAPEEVEEECRCALAPAPASPGNPRVTAATQRIVKCNKMQQGATYAFFYRQPMCGKSRRIKE
jgi:hypothetical protein